MAVVLDSWVNEVIAVLITLVSGLYFYFRVKFQHWRKKGLPYVEPSFPFGNLWDVAFLRKTVGDTFKDLYRKLDGHKVGGIYQIHKPTLLLRDPDFIKTILVKDFASFHDHGTTFLEDIDPLTANLFFLEGTRWRNMRYKLAPAFTSGKMKILFPLLHACGEELKDCLAPIASNKETTDIKEILARYTTDIIASCAFGVESNCLKNPNSEFRQWGKRIFEPSGIVSRKHMIMFIFPQVAKMFSIPTNSKEVTQFFMGVVRETLQHREKFQITRNDFMDSLIKIKNEKMGDLSKKKDEQTSSEKEIERNIYDTKGLTDEELAAQAFAFFFAGFETTSVTINFCLYELALNQEIQDRLRAEIDSKLADHGGELTYEAIMSCEYLDRVISETLRKYPPLPNLMRVCNKKYSLPESGVEVERGTLLLVPVFALHYDPKHYPNPKLFDPERFTEEAKRNRHQYVYLPFGEGPRVCIGARFGTMVIKAGIVAVLSAYKLEVCRKSTCIPLVLNPKMFILTPKNGIRLKFAKREQT